MTFVIGSCITEKCWNLGSGDCNRAYQILIMIFELVATPYLLPKIAQIVQKQWYFSGKEAVGFAIFSMAKVFP